METIKINKKDSVQKITILDSNYRKKERIGELSYTAGTLYCDLDKTITIHEGDKVYFNKYAKDYDDTIYLVKSNNTTIREISGNTLIFDSMPYNDFFISEFDTTSKTVTFSSKLNLFPEDIAKNQNIQITVYKDDSETIVLSGIKCISVDSNNVETVITASTYEYPKIVSSSKYYFANGVDSLTSLGSNYGIYRCKANTSPYYYVSGNTVNLYKYVDVFLADYYYNVSVPFGINYGENLLQEENINDLYVNDIKSNILPSLVDMEKVKFTPVYKDGSTYVDISQIEVNFHFRDRSDTTGWTVTENGWINEKYINRSDLMSDLDFTEDDIRYQANKVKKSFARFSYYDSIDPLTQMLLTYTTVFNNTNELYSKYAKYKNENKNYTITDENKRIDTKLTITDMYDEERSSQGFYLYLYNNEVSTEGEEKEIYMNVQYNHAGYGRTISFMKPYIVSSEYKGVPLEKYYENLYIKFKLKYLVNEKRYVYIIDENEIGSTVMIDKDNDIMTINVFECKLDD